MWKTFFGSTRCAPATPRGSWLEIELWLESVSLPVSSASARCVALRTPACVSATADLLHAVDEFHRRHRRKHHPLRRKAAAGDRRVWLELVKPGDAELDAKRLAVEIDVVDAVGEDLPAVELVDVANACGGRRRGRRARRAFPSPLELPSFYLVSSELSPSPVSLMLRQRQRAGW